MNKQPMRMREKLIIRILAKALIPFILLFALYVQFHGDFGPGGGFQAGVIFGAGIILYSLIFGLKDAKAVFPNSWAVGGSALGVHMSGGVGVAAMFLGGEFLNYSVLAHDPAHGQHIGIILIELGVGLTVTCTMIVLFYALAGRTLILRGRKS